MTTEIINQTIKKMFTNISDNYIFIYTPPKVGSTTLVSSLRVSLGNSYNIIHIHDEVMLEVLTGIKGVTLNEIIQNLSEKGKRVFVIDVYRTPIERKMSEFFEKLSPYHFNNTEENIGSYSITRISDRFNKVFPHIENGDHYFDRYNIADPVPFDFEKKYTIQEVGNIKYIKLRLCDTSQWSNILSIILNTDIVLVTDYETERKQIGQLYKRFRNEYRLPRNFFEDVKGCRYFNFYYNEIERKQYLDKWINRLTDPVSPYTVNEYQFYINLCLENQYINDIQSEHYIDNGCFCKFCTQKRREIYFKIKRGEKNIEKIIHREFNQKKVFQINKLQINLK